MAGIDIGSTATIAVNVELNGVEQGKQSLNAFGTAGAASAKRVEDAYKQVAASAMDFARAGANAAQIARLTGASMSDARNATQLYARTLATVEEEIRGVQRANQELAEAGFLKVSKAAREMTAAANATNPALNSVRASLTSTAAAAVGSAVPGLAQVTSVLGTLAIGTGPMVAILAGIAAVGFGIEHWRESAKKAKEEVDALFKRLDDLAKKQQQGIYGQTGADVKTGQAELTRIAAEIRHLQEQAQRERAAGGGLFQAGGVDVRIRELRDEYNKKLAAVEAGERELGRITREEAAKRAEDAKRLADEERRQAEQLARDTQTVVDNAMNPLIASLKATSVAYDKGAEAAIRFSRATEDVYQSMRGGIKAAPLPDLLPNVYGDNLFTLPSNAAAKQHADEMNRIFRESFGKIATDGLKSWQDMFDDILRGFSSLMAEMEREAKRTGEQLGGSHKALQMGSAGIIGGIAGYGVGSQVGSAGGGFFAGAGAGALAGSAFGPWGAVIGGLTGAAGGLLGGAKAHQEAAQRLKEAADAFRNQSASYIAGAQNNPVSSALIGNQQQYEALATALRGLGESGAIGPREFNAQSQALFDAMKQINERIKTDFLDDLTHRFNSLQGAAGAYANALLDAEKAYQQDLKAADALALGEDTLAKIRAIHAQTLEDLRRAEEHRVQQIDAGLAVRAAIAGGQDKYAEELRVRAQQEDELFRAQQDHWSDEQISRLKNVQALEDQKRALDEATAAAERNATAQASAQERYLRATGQDDALFAFQQAAERSKNILDLAKGIIDRTTFDWLEMARGAESAAREDEKAAAAAQKVRDSQREAIQLQQRAIDEQIRGAEQILNTTRQAIDGARKYLNAGLLGSTSPLGPQARYDEARRQYLALGSAAEGGDVKAFAQLPDAVEAFRRASQDMFASGQRRADDFNASQIYLESLTSKFGVQATIQEQMLATLNAQRAILDQQLGRLQTAGIPKDITDGIVRALPDASTQPVRWPTPRENPGLDPIRRLPVLLEQLLSETYNLGQKILSVNDGIVRTHSVLAGNLPDQTVYQRQTRDNTKVTADGIVRLPRQEITVGYSGST